MNTFTKTYARRQRDELKAAYKAAGINPALAERTFVNMMKYIQRKDPVLFGSELEHGWSRLERYGYND